MSFWEIASDKNLQLSGRKHSNQYAIFILYEMVTGGFRKSHLLYFKSHSRSLHTTFVLKMAASGHFGCSKITFD